MRSVDRRDARSARRDRPVSNVEQALAFECGGDALIGILTVPPAMRDVGVVIVVGGPQYRVGSHRQFVHLARALAREGFPAFRFDYRGMGDSEGAARSFEDVSEDVAAAIAAFRGACPGIAKIVLWGLCDAASAALLYVGSARGTPIAGLVLANPWVRGKTTLARTHVKHYYRARLFEARFWARLLRGDVRIVDACRGFAKAVRSALRGSDAVAGVSQSFRERMASGLAAFRGPVLLLLSGRDLTAREFEEHVRADAAWNGLLRGECVERCDLLEADHTFSDPRARVEVETATVRWLARRFVAASG